MKLTRRTLLQGILGGAVVGIGLPPLERFMNTHGTAYADAGGGFPKRFILFHWGNGNHPDTWVPEGEGATWELTEQLAPLAAVKSEITLVTGMRVEVPNLEPHHSTACGMLTGRPLVMENGQHTFPGPTIDQILAAEIGGDTLYRSLEFGSEPGEGLSYNGPYSLNPAEKSPFVLFERLFGGSFKLPGDEAVVDPTLALRRSVLDAVMSDISSVRSLLGQNDKTRLEQHLDGVRAIEKRLAKLEEDPPNLAACGYPTTPEAEYPEIDGRPQLHEKNAIFSELGAMALACDQTRVYSNFFTKPLTNILFPGAPAGHHKMTHDEPAEQPEVGKIIVHCMEGLATQVAALAAIQEGDGTLLDHSLLLATSDVSSGKVHSGEEFPIILAGTAGGAIKKGVHVRSHAADNASKVLMSICQAFGMTIGEFGEAEGHVTEGFSEIEV